MNNNDRYEMVRPYILSLISHLLPLSYQKRFRGHGKHSDPTSRSTRLQDLNEDTC